MLIDGERAAKIETLHYDYNPPAAMTPPSQGQQKPIDPRFDRKYTYKYDPSGNRIEKVIFRNDGSQVTRSAAKFDEKGNKIKLDIYSPHGRLNYSRGTTYDGKGNEVESTHYNSDGTAGNRYAYTEYEFDSNGNWTRRKRSKIVDKDGKSYLEPVEVTYRTITYH